MGEGLQWFFNTIANLPGEGLQWGVCNGGKVCNTTPAQLTKDKLNSLTSNRYSHENKCQN